MPPQKGNFKTCWLKETLRAAAATLWSVQVRICWCLPSWSCQSGLLTCLGFSITYFPFCHCAFISVSIYVSMFSDFSNPIRKRENVFPFIMPTAILAEAYCFYLVLKKLACLKKCFLWFSRLNILHRTQIH